MQRALTLARQVGARSRPNPRVGAVLTQGAQIIGEGATLTAGNDHAEIVALKNAFATVGKDGVIGSTLYVSLEPCAHFGRTPPCVNALIDAKISRVVVATRDPFPEVAGAGIAALLSAGVLVQECTAESNEASLARDINAGFFSRIERQKPFCRLKIASSVDGITALANGQSQWITGPAARRDGHHWRAQSCAVLTGIGTILADNPQLTVRDAPMTTAPERVVIDSQARIPFDAKILQTGPIHIFCAEENLRTEQLRHLGHHLWICPQTQAHVDGSANSTAHPSAQNTAVDLHAVMTQLARLALNEVLIEAGAILSSALLQSQIVDEVLCYLAPKILGQGRGWVNWQLSDLSAGKSLQLIEQTLFDEDIRLRWRCQY